MQNTRIALWRLCLASALSWGLISCDGEPPEPPPRAQKIKKAPPAEKLSPPESKAAKMKKAPVKAPPKPARDHIAFGEEGALKLVEGLRDAASGGRQEVWLAAYAVFPFDVDGVHRAGNAAALTVALAKEHPKLAESLAQAKTCEALTRARILDGVEAFHYIDRLGQRPPKAELGRDLDRLGLGKNDVLVNCFEGERPGMFFVVVDRGGEAWLRALRK